LLTLAETPPGAVVRVIEIMGGRGMRLRLMRMGLNLGDLVKVLSSGPLRGPVYLENLSTGVKLALGRGVASKVLVEPQ